MENPRPKSSIGFSVDLLAQPSSETRVFHPTVILTVIHDRNVCKGGIKGVYDLLEFLTGRRPFTRDLPNICDAVKPYLVEWHEGLGKENIEHVCAANHSKWLDEIEHRFGTDITVTRPERSLTET